MQECWVSIMPMWSILGLGCRTLRLAPSKFYGCDGMKLLTQIQGLQDGIVWHWACCASHPYTKTIPLALWIQKLYYDGVISSQNLTRENENPMLFGIRIACQASRKAILVMLHCPIHSGKTTSEHHHPGVKLQRPFRGGQICCFDYLQLHNMNLIFPVHVYSFSSLQGNI